MKTRQKPIFFLLLALLGLQTSFAQSVYQDVHRRTGKVVEYKRALRNLATYPVNSAANAAFLANLQPTGSIAVENRPGPAWLSGVRVTYVEPKKFLAVEAAGQPVTLRFERKDGIALVGKNPDGVSVNSTDFFGPGELRNQGAFTQQWTFGTLDNGTEGIPSVPLRLTFRNSSGQTFAHEFLPLNGASRSLLFGSPGVTPSGCDYSLAVNSPSASCGASVNLTASASGTAATGISYQWANGPPTQSWNLNAPGSNGSYTYQVSASKSGCANKTAQAIVTVSGCAVTTATTGSINGVAFSWEVPTQAISWDGYDSRRIGFQNTLVDSLLIQQNDKLKLEVRKGFGCLNQIFHKALNKYLVNNPDQGRGDGYSSYTGPKTYSDDATGPWRTYYNPLKNGDWSGIPSRVLAKGRITWQGNQYIYTKTQLLSWSHINRYEKTYYEEWRSLQGNKVDIWTRIVHDRDDVTDYGPYQQEWPIMMINGFHPYVRAYHGDSPYTRGSTLRSDSFERFDTSLPTNSPYYHVIAGRAFQVSEPWIGVEIGNNELIAQYSPEMYRVSFNWMDAHEGGDCDGCGTGMYTGNHPLSNFDAKGVFRKHHVWIVGTENEVRDFVYAQNHTDTPSWSFNQSTERNGWVGWDGITDQQLPFTDNLGWKTQWVGKSDNGSPVNINDSKLRSPYTSFKASSCPTIYIKGAYNAPNGPTVFRLLWNLVGQEPEGYEVNRGTNPPTRLYPNMDAVRYPKGERNTNQQTNFTLNGDGQERTYTVNPGWSGQGYVSQFEIQPTYPGNNVFIAPGQQFRVTYIGCTPPN